MKFSISSGTLLKILTVLSKAISRSEPILENFLFVTPGEGKLVITATDKELTLRSVVDVDDCTEGAPICVPAKILTELLKTLPELPIEVSTEEDILAVEWFGGKSTIHISDGMDYPDISSVQKDSAQKLSFPSGIFLELIQKTLPATAVDLLRPALTCICFTVDNKHAEAAASESHMMLIAETDKVTSETPGSFLLQRKAAATLKGLLPNDDTVVDVLFDNQYIEIAVGETLLICRTVTQKFPKYQSVIPPRNGNPILVDRVALLEAVRRVCIFSNMNLGHIAVGVSENSILLEGSDFGLGMRAKDTVVCSYSGDGKQMTFKGEFLSQILYVFDDKNINIELTEPKKPALFYHADEKERDVRLCSVLMPVVS